MSQHDETFEVQRPDGQVNIERRVADESKSLRTAFALWLVLGVLAGTASILAGLARVS